MSGIWIIPLTVAIPDIFVQAVDDTSIWVHIDWNAPKTGLCQPAPKLRVGSLA